MGKKTKRERKNKQVLALALLLVVLTAILLAFFVRYYQLERQGCATRLQEHTQTAGRQVRDAVRRSQTYLDTISDIVYDTCMDSEVEGRALLASLGDVDLISRLELAVPTETLPDDVSLESLMGEHDAKPAVVLYTADGLKRDPTLFYSDMLNQGTGATIRSTDQLSGTSEHIIRIFVPVGTRGRTKAILCGVVELSRLQELFPVAAYDRQAKLYLMESTNGNFLIDPDHEKPGNRRDLESYLFTGGYSKEQFFQETHQNTSGFTIMRSPNSNSSDYIYYCSVDFQDWMVMLSVKEDVAFAQSKTVLLLFVVMLAIIAGLTLLFLVWFFRHIRRQQAQTELQLQGGRYMLSVQQTLFRAHIDPGGFERALEQVANYLTADVAAYYALTPDGQLIMQEVGGAVTKAPPRKADFQSFFPSVTKTLLQDGYFSSNRPFLWGDEDRRSAREIGIRNMMMVRLDSIDGKKPLGMLCAINADVYWADTEPLDQVALTFTTAVENRQNYQALAYISQVDELTGLMNRNSYHARLDELEGRDGGVVGCVYIDANGLHEINNHLGHDAGDEMLRSVADALLVSFEKKDTFRLGGDEFAVLTSALSKEELERKAKAVSEAVEKCGYTISVGLEWQRGQFHIASIVAAAEAAMRQNKAEFYAGKGGERQMRNLNTRLEQTLSAKRDADTLLSYLAPNLLGVFFVDPEKDTCRHIVIPPYLEKVLKSTGGIFSSAIDIYITEQVVEEDRQALVDFCHYDQLLARLRSDGTQEIHYRKLDGTQALLQVRHPQRAGDNPQDIMWLFTQTSL